LGNYFKRFFFIPRTCGIIWTNKKSSEFERSDKIIKESYLGIEKRKCGNSTTFFYNYVIDSRRNLSNLEKTAIIFITQLLFP
jgi:hypothetical protein